jgi:ribose 5-phosphate isomerase B
MKIAIGSDHAGFRYKQMFVDWLRANNYEVLDLGVDSGDEPADYTVISEAVARAVLDKEADRGVIVAGSGNGEAITANKLPGIRAGVCNDIYTAEMNRLHNDGNVLCIGQRVVGEAVATRILETWLTTPFEGGRHVARLENITALEERIRKEYR